MISPDGVEPTSKDSLLSSLDALLPSAEESNADTRTVDFFLQRIGFTRYHYLLYFFACCGFFSVGLNFMALSLIQVTFETIGYNELELSVTDAIYCIGSVFGCIIFGVASDKYGRKLNLQIVSGVSIAAAMLSIISPEFWFTISIRVLMGIGNAGVVIAAVALPLEITPKNYRGKIVTIVYVSMSLGFVAACLIAAGLFKNPEQGNWQLLMVISACPMMITFIASLFYINESVRWSLNNRFDQGIENLKELATIKSITIEDAEIENLHLWVLKELAVENHDDSRFISLFKGKYARITILLWLMKFIIGMIYYGICFSLPLTLSSNKLLGDTTFYQIGIILIGEVAAAPVTYFLIELPSLGRKLPIVLSFVVVGVALILGYFMEGNVFLGLCFVAIFFLQVIYYYLGTLQAEVYPTSIRSTGL
jgi:MFS family permease